VQPPVLRAIRRGTGRHAARRMDAEP